METKRKRFSKRGSILKNFASIIDAKYEEFKLLDATNVFKRIAAYLLHNENTKSLGFIYKDTHKLESDLGIYMNKKKKQLSKEKVEKEHSSKSMGQMTIAF